MQSIRKVTDTILAAIFAIGTTGVPCFAASQFEGKWNVADTAGKPFEITLSGNGKATASRGEGMVGTWKEVGNPAVISWRTGWESKITAGAATGKASWRKSGTPSI
jgi:hypothetical protein